MSPASRQRGISLIMVLLVLVLVALTALSASRSALFNETVTGNEADYNRAMAAAEALVRDAQIDIVGYPAVGVPCRNGPLFIGCRLSVDAVPAAPTAALPFFPQPNNANDGDDLRDALGALPIPCAQGICAPAAWPANALPDRFWFAANFAATFVPLAARYGQHTLANGGATGNPILNAANPQAWYWVELIPNYAVFRCTGVGCPTKQSPYIYRITAVALGRRANTIGVIQTFFVPTPPSP
ncbi:MAG: pilus assembly protein [Betaproteobacteria bacterium]|jgi:type IV pilus assembly protein PilX|nr:pilus assembly protein [Betaproteobacteria bacterium]MBK7655860.1 pilus assembly protein [Betaproteobacteria bacterium]MBP6645005.1 pilus assembly protein [Burkholderiaceae bacterium]